MQFRSTCKISLQVTDLLYEKQSLLERLSAERSAQQLSFEQQLGSLRTDAEKGKRYIFQQDLFLTYILQCL